MLMEPASMPLSKINRRGRNALAIGPGSERSRITGSAIVVIVHVKLED